MKIGIVDNYDSFTYNLVHYLEGITDHKPKVWKNDQIDWEEIKTCTHLVLSPGPGLPESSGDLFKVIDLYHASKNILGVCLGMQALGIYFGGSLINLAEVVHGMSTNMRVENHSNNCLYKNLPDSMEVGRYHSWVIDEHTLGPEWIVTAKDDNGSVMSIQHSTYALCGVQYHPESIMTPHGKAILKNWIEGI